LSLIGSLSCTGFELYSNRNRQCYWQLCSFNQSLEDLDERKSICSFVSLRWGNTRFVWELSWSVETRAWRSVPLTFNFVTALHLSFGKINKERSWDAVPALISSQHQRRYSCHIRDGKASSRGFQEFAVSNAKFAQVSMLCKKLPAIRGLEHKQHLLSIGAYADKKMFRRSCQGLVARD
jgi:hypothetical protein